MRSAQERIADVRRLLAAARAVYAQRARWAPAIAGATGLSPEGVELGFSSLERDASDEDLGALVAAAGDASHVHVVLSSNVFVAPLRAIALARAQAARVTVRPSPRDPALTHALIEAAGDRAICAIDERDVARIEATEIHVYGRDETIAAVRARARSGVVISGHGAGLGLAVVTRAAGIESTASAIAADVVPFDQRGCLSPRIALVEGDPARGHALARALHEELARWALRVPRGPLLEDEGAEVRRWIDSLSFAGSAWVGPSHAVGLLPPESPLALPPAGRHILVATFESLADGRPRIAPLAPFIVAVGSNDVERMRALAPAHARWSLLGRMQHPALDGPVDLRVFRR